MIPSGFILLSRKIDESDVFRMPPVTRELWLYILRKVSHKPHGNLKRGQGFFRFSDVQRDLSWLVGYRVMKYSKPQLTKSLRRLNEGKMIETTKATRGILITVCNYDFYQSIKNYEGNGEEPTKETRRKQKGHTINKNVKNEEEYIYNIFYDSELFKSENDTDYKKFIEVLFGKNSLTQKLESVLSMQHQMTYEQFKQLMFYKTKYKLNVTPLLEAMENNKNLKDRKSLWLTLQTYMKTKYPETIQK